MKIYFILINKQMTTFFSNFLSKSKQSIHFELKNVPVALANSLRRCMLSEIPTLSFDDYPKKTLSFLDEEDLKRDSIP